MSKPLHGSVLLRDKGQGDLILRGLNPELIVIQKQVPECRKAVKRRGERVGGRHCSRKVLKRAWPDGATPEACHFVFAFDGGDLVKAHDLVERHPRPALSR